MILIPVPLLTLALNPEMTEKFAVLKSREGWGDRLEVLLCAIEYCNRTGRTLVLDWRDKSWNDQHEYITDQYFNIDLNIKTLSWDRFLRRLPSMDHESVIPTGWKNIVHKEIFQTKQGQEDLKLTIDECRQLCNTHYEIDHKEDIVVITNNCHRFQRYRYFAYIHFTPRIILKAKQFLESNQILGKKYDTLHLRGHNKFWYKKPPMNKGYAIRNQIEWKTEQKYIKKLAHLVNIREEKRPVVVVTDDYSLFEKVSHEINGQCFCADDFKNLNYGEESGPHKLDFSLDDNKHLCRDDINIATLRDFLLMLNSEQIICDNVSYFSRNAIACKQYNINDIT